MSAAVRIRRGQVPKTPRRRPVRQTAAPPHMVRLPIAPTKLAAWVSSLVALLCIAGGSAALWLMGIPQQMWFEVARRIADAGFEVRHIEVAGLDHLSKLPVYDAALEGASNSMLLVDLDEVRDRLRTLPWVADASVARRLPDTLQIAIIERRPVALWQHRRRLAVIDAHGRVLEAKRLERFATLPLIVGERANEQARSLLSLLAAFPEVQQRVDSAIWIGDRRWDIRFKTGETLALPEGYGQARAALIQFARMQDEAGLLERGFARFDMRLPDRMVVRVSGEPGARALPRTGTEI